MGACHRYFGCSEVDKSFAMIIGSRGVIPHMRSSFNQGRFSYFIAVAEMGTITKAANVLHVSQPSLTQYLNRLESDLGVKLLNRDTTPITLTQAGSIYLEYVRSVLTLEKQLKNDLNQLKHGKEQTLTLGIPSQLIPLIFESCVQNFISQHPDIDVRITEGNSITTKKQLLDGQVDIAFFHTVERSESLFMRKILQEESLFLATSSDNSIVKGKKTLLDGKVVPLNASDIRLINEMQLISYGDEYYLHNIVMSYLQRLHVSPKNTINVPNLHAVGNYISKTEYNGIAILPGFVLNQLESDNNIVYLKPVGVPNPVWYLTVNALANQNLSKCAQTIWKSVPTRIDLH